MTVALHFPKSQRSSEHNSCLCKKNRIGYPVRMRFNTSDPHPQQTSNKTSTSNFKKEKLAWKRKGLSSRRRGKLCSKPSAESKETKHFSLGHQRNILMTLASATYLITNCLIIQKRSALEKKPYAYMWAKLAVTTNIMLSKRIKIILEMWNLKTD